MKTYILYCAIILANITNAQDKLEGVILETLDNKEITLAGANVFWLNTSVGTITDENGVFSIDYQPTYTKLVISYVGFKTDTLNILCEVLRSYNRMTGNVRFVTM